MSIVYINQFSHVMVFDSSGELQSVTEGFRLHSAEFDTRNVYNKINPAQIFPATFITQRYKFGYYRAS